jgi:hypothetical protein
MSEQDQTNALAKFAEARDRFFGAFDAVPDDALIYRPPEDDFAVGGIPAHVAQVLRNYRNTLLGMIDADFSETTTVAGSYDTPQQRPENTKNGISSDQRAGVLADVSLEHNGLADAAGGLTPEQCARSAPVRYGVGADPYDTTALAILGWVTDHYMEHVDQINSLVARWRSENSA